MKYGTEASDFDSLLSILRSLVKSVYIDCVTEEEILKIDAILPNNYQNKYQKSIHVE